MAFMLSLALLFVGAAGRHVQADDAAVLSRPEFDRELSVQMQQAPLANVFRALGAMINVRFVLSFDPDPALKIDLKAEHMVCRGILASLAKTHDLEYGASDEAVVVRRRGSAEIATVATSGADRLRSAYWFVVTARTASGESQTFPRLVCPEDKVTTRRFILRNPDQEVSVLDGQVRAITTRNVGDFQLSIAVSQDSVDQIEVSAELVAFQRHSASRYTEEHLVTTRTLPPTETLLFRSSRGDEVFVTRWGRIDGGAAPQ